MDVENSIVLTATSDSLLDVQIMNGDVLYVTPKSHENGETDVVIRATANGLFTETSIHFTVVPVNDNVEVNRTLASLVVYEDSEDLSVDLSHVFVDVDNHLVNISATVLNSNPQELLQVSIIENIVMKLSFEENAHGEATIRLVGLSEDGSNIHHDVNVKVQAVDDAPILAHLVADMEINDSGDHQVELATVFQDVDSEIVIRL